MLARLAVLIVLAFAAVGCGGDDAPPESAGTATPTPNPTTEAETTPAAPGSAANAFIGSLAIDPGDGTLMIGTGLGLFRAKTSGGKAKRVVGELAGPDGSGPVSSNLVLRYAAPGDLLASGHPEGAGTALPEDLGLMRSGDAGASWEPISQLGESDFHILQARGDHVVAVRVEEADIQISTDGGEAFAAVTGPDLPLDVEFDPGNPSSMVVATGKGTFTSDDQGASWRPRDPIPSDQLAWVASGELYRADPGGAVKVSADGGATWKERGNVGLTVNELVADGKGALYASVPGGEIRRSTDGGASWKLLLRLE